MYTEPDLWDWLLLAVGAVATLGVAGFCILVVVSLWLHPGGHMPRSFYKGAGERRRERRRLSERAEGDDRRECGPR